MSVTFCLSVKIPNSDSSIYTLTIKDTDTFSKGVKNLLLQST